MLFLNKLINQLSRMTGAEKFSQFFKDSVNTIDKQLYQDSEEFSYKIISSSYM
jgi:conjugal transfer/entry exclusion protein